MVRLAKDLDQRVGELRTRFGEIGDMRLLVMAALTVADELAEAGKRLRQLEHDLAGLENAGAVSADRSKAAEAALAAAIGTAAERIERVAKSLNQGLGEEIALG